MRAINHNCKDCNTEKNIDNTYTYNDTRSGKVRFKSRCKECDKEFNTIQIYNNWERHKAYARKSARKKRLRNSILERLNAIKAYPTTKTSQSVLKRALNSIYELINNLFDSKRWSL